MQRSKGARWEREVARRFREAMPGCEAKRGYQRRGGDEAPDVDVPGLWLECKAGAKPNPRAALAQALADASPGRLAVAVVKDDRREPFAVLLLDDLLDILSEVWTLRRL